MATESAKLSVIPENFDIYPSSAPESCIQVTNVSFVPVLYRALSTAPKQFQVRPRQGTIESGKSETIVITYTNKNEDGGATTSATGGDAARKEEFKIEYVKMTSEHEEAIRSANGNASIVTDLIKASPKGEKKSRVITCNINAVEKATTAAAVAPATVAARASTASPAAEEEKKKAAAAPASSPTIVVSRAAELKAQTEALTATSPAAQTSETKTEEPAGLRSRAKTESTTPAASKAAPSTAATPAVATTTTTAAAAAGLPAQKAAPNGAQVSLATNPLGFLKENPLYAVAAFIALYLIVKLLF